MTKRLAVLMLAVAMVAAILGCDSHGTRLEFNKGELYYKQPVTAAEANKLGNFLVQEKFYDGNPKTVQLTKNGDTYEFRMVVKPGMEKNEAYLKLCKLFVSELSQKVFSGAKVKVILCDPYLKTLDVIEEESAAAPPAPAAAPAAK